MKLSDYVAKFIKSLNVKHVFVLTGGADAHIIDSIDKEDDLEYICHHHEQASAMAADAYARVTGNIGVAVTTSGPGATNLLTGCCCAYYDSVPVLYITGQVSAFRFKGNSGIRQYGFQETDTVDIFKPVTKYSVLIKDPYDIRYELEKAVYIAMNGRKGPVVVDIPDNFQRMEIDETKLKAFSPDDLNKENTVNDISDCIKLISMAKRPILIIGWGIRLSCSENEILELINILNIPVLQTWAVMDFLPHDHCLNVGSFGIHGTRYGNFAVQNSDLVLAIGTRLDTHLTGSPITSFAREAKKIVVDVDLSELNKFEERGLDIDLKINMDAKKFLKELLLKIKSNGIDLKTKDIDIWKNKISEWKNKYVICHEDYYKEKDLNPYVFVKTLSQKLKKDKTIFVDTGCSIAWMLQGFEFKDGQRLFSAFNNTPMGYALPASTGASFALNNKEVICVTGDGGLQMNIQELATVIRYKLPIKIFVVNNNGYGMIQQTQDQWFESRYTASDVKSGLGFPNFENLARVYGFLVVSIKSNEELEDKIEKALEYEGPVFCNLEIPIYKRVIPQSKFGRPIEDQEPLLGRSEFFKEMIVSPVKESLEE